MAKRQQPKKAADVVRQVASKKGGATREEIEKAAEKRGISSGDIREAIAKGTEKDWTKSREEGGPRYLAKRVEELRSPRHEPFEAAVLLRH